MRRALILLALSFVAFPVQATPAYFPGNGHSYELVETQTTWANALAAASAAMYGNVPGHLATVTSAEENSFLSTTFASGQAQYFAWLAGYEPNDDGVWLWGAGPEAGVQFSQGAASTPPYNFAAWDGIEPNDFAPGEDFLAMNLGATFANIDPGGWGDAPNPNPADPIRAYIVEYETLPTGVGDPPEAGLRVHSATPNPFRISTRVEYSHSGGVVEVDILDVAGRCVRKLVRASENGGVHAFEWNGRDDEGRPMKTGVYLYRVRAGSERVEGRLILIH